jgi:hypothetical protein
MHGVVRAAAVLAVLLAHALTGDAGATTIDFLGQVKTMAAAPCTKIANYTCSTFAYFDNMSLDDQNDEQNIAQLFVNAFDTWDAMQKPNAKWTLVFGGNPGGIFNIFVSSAAVTDPDPDCNGFGPKGGTCGGTGIKIALRMIKPPAVGANEVFGWAQGVYGNYENDGTKTVAPFYEMDVLTGPCGLNANPICPPMYSFQTPDYKFGDAPAFQFLPPGSTQAFFQADT